ncbi:hypothetical protein LEP1GSC052_0283 [Leptospira kmetyi serovar Malaysia str. Bejo-Iso9]|nr:hypothetical protein LEP1GSC052_0283 [Leptospira kmetyi serovar Malaysia str. Bejo-Iso9]
MPKSILPERLDCRERTSDSATAAQARRTLILKLKTTTFKKETLVYDFLHSL